MGKELWTVMAKISDIKIKFDIESIVKVECAADNCKYNIEGHHCNLKHIIIGLNNKNLLS